MQKLDSVEEDLEKQLTTVETHLRQTLPDLQHRDSSTAEYVSQQTEQLKVLVSCHNNVIWSTRVCDKKDESQGIQANDM
jgi:hypothetical protein